MADHTAPSDIDDDDTFWDRAERLAHTPCESVADALACARLLVELLPQQEELLLPQLATNLVRFLEQRVADTQS